MDSPKFMETALDKAMHANAHAHEHMREADTERGWRGIENFKKLGEDGGHLVLSSLSHDAPINIIRFFVSVFCLYWVIVGS